MRKSLVAVFCALSVLGACTMEPTAVETSAEEALVERNALINAGLDAYMAGDMAGAEAAFRQVLAANPSDPFANLNLGAIKAKTNRSAEAVAHYKTAIANGREVPVEQIYGDRGPVPGNSVSVADVAAGNLKRLELN